jgi:hypothetical protein
MKKRVALLAIGITGLLIVFALLAFSYAPHIIAASPAAVFGHPLQMEGDKTTVDKTSTVDNASNVEAPADAPVHRIGSACDGGSADSASTGY